MRIIHRTKEFSKKTILAWGIRPEYLKLLSSNKQFSKFDEEILLKKYSDSVPSDYKTDFIVDIAASDGVTMSNTYSLFNSGVPGLALEFDSNLFSRLARTYRHLPKVNLLKVKVTPQNIISILDGCNVPKNFSILNLDIDSYDYFVLDALLESYRPSVICAEINEKIPPPLKFTVKYSPAYFWGTNHFFGQSISQLYVLCEKYDYDLVELHYNNAFLITKESNKHLSLKPEDAYDAGYRLKKDREEKFSYNEDMDPVLDMKPEEAKHFIKEAFKLYEGRYDLS